MPRIRDKCERMSKDAVDNFYNDEPEVESDSDGEGRPKTSRCMTVPRTAPGVSTTVIRCIVAVAAHTIQLLYEIGFESHKKTATAQER